MKHLFTQFLLLSRANLEKMENPVRQDLPDLEVMLEKTDLLDLKDLLVHQETTEKGELQVL